MRERVALETDGELRRRRKLVRTRRRRVPRQPVHPSRAVEGEGVPALRAPRLADATLLEHDVLDAAPSELTTDAQSRLTGADDKAVDAFHWHARDARPSVATPERGIPGGPLCGSPPSRRRASRRAPDVRHA